jgi:hypothetical protein
VVLCFSFTTTFSRCVFKTYHPITNIESFIICFLVQLAVQAARSPGVVEADPADDRLQGRTPVRTGLQQPVAAREKRAKHDLKQLRELKERKYEPKQFSG